MDIELEEVIKKMERLECYGIEHTESGDLLPIAVLDRKQADEMRKMLVKNNPGTTTKSFKPVKIVISRS